MFLCWGNFLSSSSLWKSGTAADMFMKTTTPSHYLCCSSFLFSFHIIFLHILLSLSPSVLPLSSLRPCFNLAVSHLVMVLPKSHFLGRNTLAEGCSAITCQITRLSLTISLETGDSGLRWTQPS